MTYPLRARAPRRPARLLRAASLVAVSLAVVPGASARPGGGSHYTTHSSPSRSTTHSSGGSTYHATPSHSSSPVYHPPRPTAVPYTPRSETSTTTASSTGGGGGAAGAIVMLVILALVVALVVFVIWRARRGRGRATITVEADVQGRGIAALRAQDPAFDPAAFTARVKATMAKVNEAWLAGAMGPARRLVSDGVYVRFQTQLALLRRSGQRNVMGDWRVVSADILAAEADALWDTVHVKVVGEARDTEVRADASPHDVERALHGVAVTQYEEVWSLLRRRGKKSQAGVPALEGRCPSCGADVPLAEAVRCEYCKAVINSGEHDWVLAEITQPEEWRAGAVEGAVPGMDALRARDPGVSRQELEDRASVMFWKWVEARLTDERTKLGRFCVEPPDDAHAHRLRLVPARMKDVAVGSSELARVQPGPPDGFDRAEVEVKWSASVDGQAPDGYANRFVLFRSTQAKSRTGLSSLDCPVCGGALAESDAVKCPYCGEALHGGKHEWALGEVVDVDLG